MSGIEAVIARSRREGGFSERKQFSVARSRGIEKLRKFALANPHEYILELIQSAIANGAQHIDIALEQNRCTLSYIGGGLLEAELGQLFDFLFASKDRTDIGHVRELALGINAVLMFQPDRVVVESGDGTLPGTTRMVLHGDTDQVEVGRPEQPLTGTFVHIEGMKRSRLRSFRDLRDPPRERGIIEEKCLAAPIPIIVNHESLFGYTSQRTPGLFGYRRALSFDEGDLYGTLGIDPSFGRASFQLLTRGVAIQSKVHDLLPGSKVGGIVCFDALRKTVDHSGIVEDERLEEMWVRLLPYARQLATGQESTSPYQTSLFGGPVLPAADLRRLLREHHRVVVADPDVDPASARGQRAAAIGRILQAPVLSSPLDIIPSLRALSGGRIGIVTPDLESDRALSFYENPQLDPPTRPWLTAPVEVDSLGVDHLARRINPELADDPQRGRGLRLRLGEVGSVEATVYTQQESSHRADGLWVWISTTDRLVSQHVVPSAYPGHVLVVRLPDTDPFCLLGEEVAHVMAQHAVPALAAAFDGAIRTLGLREIEPGTAAAALGLAALTRSVTPRLLERDGTPTVDLVQLEAGQIDLLALPLLRTRSGRTVCMRDVTAMMNACGGLLYGTVPSVPPSVDGLDLDRVLDLDEASERLLVSLFGEGPYVRIDRRDVLATFGGVSCRDLALGLRPYPDFPLLVEGGDPSSLSDEARAACETALVQALVKRFLGLDPPEPRHPSERADWEECRRQACRHLQWYACRRALTFEGRTSGAFGHIDDLPLFLDTAGEARSYREVRAAMDHEGLLLLYGHALGGAELGILVGALKRGTTVEADREPPEAIVAGPWVHRLLAPLGPVRVAFGFDVPAHEICEAFLVSVPFETEDARGRVGVPAEPLAHKDVPVLFADNQQASVFADLAVELGVAGWVRLAPNTTWNRDDPAIFHRWSSIAMALRKAAEQVLSELIERLPIVDDSVERDRILCVLLDYAARHFTLGVDPHGQPQVNFVGELVGRILAIPVFPSRFGGLVSGWRLLQTFCGLLQSNTPDPSHAVLSELRPPLPAPAEAWIRRVLVLDRVVRAPAHDVIPPTPSPSPAVAGDHRTLATTVEVWLAHFRPDTVESNTRVWLFTREPDVFAEGVHQSIRLNADHWLVAWALRSAHVEPQVIAWLLLAVYAHINAVLEPVDNDHERIFQRRVLEALSAGTLRLIEPTTDSP
jgi:hypothetical protein